MNTKRRKTGARLGAILLSLCLIVGLLPMTAFAAEKRNTYNVYSDEVIAGGADSQVYAVTIENVDGEDLHYVYSPNVNSNASVSYTHLIGVLCVLNPVPRLGQRLKILLMPLPGSINKSCAIQSVLSLVDTLTAVFSLEILSHGRAPFPQRRKEHTTTLYSIAHGALFLKASPRIFQIQGQITSA